MNLIAGWTGIVLGCVAGALLGLFFGDENWLGGYAGWRRRLLRLGHISFFGIGLLNIAFAVTFAGKRSEAPTVAAWLFVVALGAMPAVCFLSAWRKGWKALFFVPVGSLTVAAAVTLWRLLK